MPRTIKKYANRRLYDTTASRHVTLDGIRQLVAAGEDIRVVDDTNGNDLTRCVLLQVISEMEQGGHPLLPAALLRQIIRCHGQPGQDELAGHLERSIAAFLSAQPAGATAGPDASTS
jgi:polyhydroxyalkanoate synthesis repressor PhaR